ncbi:MAG: cytochrome P450 [Acidimicrobiia bacterium]
MTSDLFDPFDPVVIENPYPFYAALRADCPVVHNAEHDIWALSRHADVHAALRDVKQFSSVQGVGSEYRPVPMMIACDPPDHTRLRRIVQRDFTPSAITSWEPRIRSLVDQLLDAAIERGAGDWSATVAMPLPVWVICEMLGLPHEDREQLTVWSDDTLTALGGRLDAETSVRVESQVIAFAEYLDAQIEQRRRVPADDLITRLLRPFKGELLSPYELVSFVMLLLVAGNETTTNLMNNFVQSMIEHPAQWERLKAAPQYLSNAIEESLRYESPIQGFFRTTTCDVTVHETTIPEGAKVMLLFGSANRDERAFVDADRFDVRREIGNHLAFGSGIHLCLGAPIARLEMQVLVRAMLDRLNRFEPAGPIVRTSNPLLRGAAELPVQVIPA